MNPEEMTRRVFAKKIFATMVSSIGITGLLKGDEVQASQQDAILTKLTDRLNASEVRFNVSKSRIQEAIELKRSTQEVLKNRMRYAIAGKESEKLKNDFAGLEKSIVRFQKCLVERQKALEIKQKAIQTAIQTLKDRMRTGSS